MEILKNYVLVAFLAASLSLSAQTNQEKLQEAFKNSISYESKGDYTNAIKQIKDLYDANSYEINLRLGWLNYQMEILPNP
jgi:hypothetical protein